MNGILKALPVAFPGVEVFGANLNTPSLCPVRSLRERRKACGWTQRWARRMEATSVCFLLPGWSLSDPYVGSDGVDSEPCIIHTSVMRKGASLTQVAQL